MVVTETLEAFYLRLQGASHMPLSMNNAGHGHFNVFARTGCTYRTPLSRRDFYKVTLLVGTGTMHYEDKEIYVDRPALVFSSPVIPSSWEPESKKQSGWFCLFTQAFIESHEHKSTLQDFPLFKAGCNPIVFLNEEQAAFVAATMGKMFEEMHSDYPDKFDLLRSYLHILMHEGLKIEPVVRFEKNISAPARITALFFELLERQFPIDSPEDFLKLKTAKDYADNLAIHANHLNRSVKEITGKTTTRHISERVLKEAHALLRHTDWNIAQIANGLGFDEPAYFTNFFKKHTGASPGVSRLMTTGV